MNMYRKPICDRTKEHFWKEFWRSLVIVTLWILIMASAVWVGFDMHLPADHFGGATEMVVDCD